MKKRKVKNGDYVTRKSYGKDILFNVEKIIKHSNRYKIIYENEDGFILERK